MDFDVAPKLVPAVSEEGNPQEEYRWAMIAAGLGAVVLAVGMFIFATNSDNREQFHIWYLVVYFISTLGFSVAFGKKKFGISMAAFVLVVLALIGSIIKFQYRADLISMAKSSDNMSLLGDYVRELPPFEVTYFPYTDGPKWVQFDKECYRRIAEKKEDLPEACKSKQSILTTYKIDILKLIKERYEVMRSTAQQIEQKKITEKTALETCLASGKCAVVPLLPVEAQVKEIEPSSTIYQEIRTAFWDIIKNEEMDATSCEWMPLCKTMFDAGIIKRTDFKTLKPATSAKIIAPDLFVPA